MPYKWELTRTETGGSGTFGELEVFRISAAGELSVLEKFYTVEQPWNDNKPFQSCIPAGEYFAVPFKSDKHGDTWAIVGGAVGLVDADNVLRYACLFHVANWADQLLGCVAPGLGRAVDPHRGPMVTRSGPAMSELRQTCPVNEAHPLTIRWEW